MQSREAAVGRSSPATAPARATQAALTRERPLVAVLRARLARARMLLSRQLVSSYENDRPDLVGVVLEAHGFNDLLEQIDFLHRAEQPQQSIIALTRSAKAQRRGRRPPRHARGRDGRSPRRPRCAPGRWRE